VPGEQVHARDVDGTRFVCKATEAGVEPARL
jgi:hypothetical protein